MGPIEEWLALTFVPNLGPRRITAVYREFGNLAPFFNEDSAQLAKVLNLSENCTGLMLKAVDLNKSRALLSACYRQGIKVLCPQSREYPSLLLECHDPPPILYYRGRLPRGPLLGVVGSRKATSYGRRVVKQLIPGLCQGGIGIVSGLALGIDAASHRACLETGGYTLAVLGNGIDICYPFENRHLQSDIVDRGGCLVSEFPPGTKPRPDHFPRRNRIISGLCMGLLVVEAGKKSGAMISVGFALEQGRDVFAVPGNIDSSQSDGTNELIRLGAKPVSRVVDILEEFNMALPLQATGASYHLNNEEEAILALLDEQGIGLDDLCQHLKMKGGLLQAHLVTLELKGLVERLPGQKYIRIKTGGAS